MLEKTVEQEQKTLHESQLDHSDNRRSLFLTSVQSSSFALF